MTLEPTGDPAEGENSPDSGGNPQTGGFFLLAYAASWGVVAAAGVVGSLRNHAPDLARRRDLRPGVAAAALIVAHRGRAGLRHELAEQWRWRLPFALWALILLGSAVVVLAAIVIAQGLGAPAGQWNDPGQLYLAIPVFLYVVVLGGPPR